MRFAILLLLLLATGTLSARTLHVDATGGDNSRDGLAAESALATIQRALDLAQPGDSVLVRPGIYHEHLVLTRGGTAEAPLRIMADQVEKDRVILTGAVRAVREKKTAWELADAALGLYRLPLDYKPTRVLADRADLLPYPALEDLKAFRFLADDYPGHKHGFAWDPAGKALYVRLRADGKYGATDPNAALMAVSPPTGGGKWGQRPSRREDFLVDLQMTGSAHVVLDGFTFETPGIAAVHTTASDLVVRNSWFYGCRSGVVGPEGVARENLPARVTVERCYDTHFPAFSDIAETIHEEAARQLAKSDKFQRLMHWQRKGGNLPQAGAAGVPYAYETGFTRRMGADWIVRNNHFYEMFEGLSAGSTSFSTGARIYSNRFERICDNAVEAEEHARDLRVYGNLVIDTFEPFSWQPREGIPLPGPIYIYDNIVTQTPATTAMWAEANFDGGLFKIGASTTRMWDNGKMGDLPRDLTTAPGGFWVVHNTLVTPRGRFVTNLNPAGWRYGGFAFVNNIVVTRKSFSRKESMGGLQFAGNFLAASAPDLPTEEKALFTTAAGERGAFYASPEELKLNESGTPDPASPVLGKGTTDRAIPVPDEIPLRADPGALPFQAVVGPQPR
jgi:hypothetical protein